MTPNSTTDTEIGARKGSPLKLPEELCLDVPGSPRSDAENHEKPCGSVELHDAENRDGHVLAQFIPEQKYVLK